MSEDRLPTDFLISAQIQIAAKQGIPIVVRRRGDNSSGVIVLKINRLDGTAHILTQVRYNDDLVWAPVSSTDPMIEAEADRYLEQQIAIDPDSWLIEIEDRQGRHWFPGRVVKL